MPNGVKGGRCSLDADAVRLMVIEECVRGIDFAKVSSWTAGLSPAFVSIDVNTQSITLQTASFYTVS